MATTPTCRKCGQQHFNFVSCKDAPEYHSRLERKRTNPETEWRPLPEGWVEWGDRPLTDLDLKPKGY